MCPARETESRPHPSGTGRDRLRSCKLITCGPPLVTAAGEAPGRVLPSSPPDRVRILAPAADRSRVLRVAFRPGQDIAPPLLATRIHHDGLFRSRHPIEGGRLFHVPGRDPAPRRRHGRRHGPRARDRPPPRRRRPVRPGNPEGRNFLGTCVSVCSPGKRLERDLADRAPRATPGDQQQQAEGDRRTTPRHRSSSPTVWFKPNPLGRNVVNVGLIPRRAELESRGMSGPVMSTGRSERLVQRAIQADHVRGERTRPGARPFRTSAVTAEARTCR